MKRIDKVYAKLKELSEGTGVDAQRLADALGLTRANVSSDLNTLCLRGKVKKSTGRPVLFTPIEDEESFKETETTLDKLLKNNRSLKMAGEQAKAAILYPPKGMHTLILGETGVGKTMFASVMHMYAIEMGKMPKDAPFITFNCADYANNSQLLLSQLYGVKKGAYTGADSDRQGLIEKANGGILFLDEVHRLPAEGQEMFFTFMDKGTFRRMGETDIERKANVLIISATTENPDSVLLKTFTRRIPMIIRIPGLRERGIEERFGLISSFFREESFRLNREILVSVNSIRAFLNYNCVNNIGQLKTDIQLVCARAYADFLSHRKDSIKINSPDLPNYIREGLYKEIEHRQIWSKLLEINSRYCVFKNDENPVLIQNDNSEESIYEMIDLRVEELKKKGVKSSEFEKIMEAEIENYFTQYMHRVNSRLISNNLSNVIDPLVISVVEEIINFSEEKLDKVFSQKVYLGMAVHIQSTIERVRRNKKIINPQLNKIRTEYNSEFNTALDCIKIIERVFDLNMPIDEAGFLAMFFVLDDEGRRMKNDNAGVLVMAHGNSTATSMAEVANELLGVNNVSGINMPLSESSQSVLNRVREHVKEYKSNSGFIFLVDMGSLTTFADIIQEEMKIPVKAVPLVSTIHVIEAARKALLGYSVDEIFKEVSGITSLYNEAGHLASQNVPQQNEAGHLASQCVPQQNVAGRLAPQNVPQQNVAGRLAPQNVPQQNVAGRLASQCVPKQNDIKQIESNKGSMGKFAIITVCMTGEGGAVAIKNFLAKHLKFNSSLFEIIPIEFIGKGDIVSRIRRIAKEKEIVSIISPFRIDMDIPQFDLQEVLDLKALKDIQYLIDVKNTYIKMGETMQNFLKNVDGKSLFEDIKLSISHIETSLGLKISTEVLIGIVLHIGCMIERLKSSGRFVEFEGKETYIEENKGLFEIVKQSLEKINNKYKIIVPDDEICYIIKFFDTKDSECSTY